MFKDDPTETIDTLPAPEKKREYASNEALDDQSERRQELAARVTIPRPIRIVNDTFGGDGAA